MAIKEDKIADIDAKSVHFQDILQKVPVWIIRNGNILFFAIFLIFLILLWFIKYPDVIISEAQVTTKNPPIEVHSLTSGRIVNFLKKNNSSVSENEWILILQNNANYKSVINLDTTLSKLQTKYFWNNINDIELNPELELGSLSTNYMGFIRSINEFKLFVEMNTQFSQIKINKKRQGGLKRINKTIINQQNLFEEERELTKINLDRHRTLYEKGVVSKLELEQKEIEYIAIQNRIEGLKNNELNNFIQEENIKKENNLLEVEQSNRYFQLRNTILSNYNNLLTSVENWKREYLITSPIEGTIDFYDIRNNQQFLTQEQKVFTITPKVKQNYFSYAKLPISNSGKVKIGQQVIIKLHNYPYTQYGMLKGTIESISSVPQSGYYSLKIALPNQLKTTSNKILGNKYELTGIAEIITEDFSLFDRMFNFIKNSNN